MAVRKPPCLEFMYTSAETLLSAQQVLEEALQNTTRAVLILKPIALSCMCSLLVFSSDTQSHRTNHRISYRFDQRGSGKSTPMSELRDNDTWSIVDDIDKIRKHLNIDKWVVFGGSWGSTLALAYAQTHPNDVLALILRGIFTLRKEELDFFYQGPGSSFFFPEEWQRYVSVIPEEERGSMVEAYYKRLTSEDAATRKQAGKAWSRWEMATSHLHTDQKALARADEDDFADAFARIEAHFFFNKGEPTLTMRSEGSSSLKAVAQAFCKKTAGCSRNHRSTRFAIFPPPSSKVATI